MPKNYLEYARRKWRNAGYYVEGTEHIVRRVDPESGRIRVNRKDLFGFVDLICVSAVDGSIVLLQVTSWSNVSARVRKIKTEETGMGQWRVRMAFLAYLLTLNPTVRIIVEGWKLDQKTHRYVSREREVGNSELAEAFV
jgi:hypothetical protein